MYSNLNFFKSAEIAHRTRLYNAIGAPFLSVTGRKSKIEWSSVVILSKLVGAVFFLIWNIVNSCRDVLYSLTVYKLGRSYLGCAKTLPQKTSECSSSK